MRNGMLTGYLQRSLQDETRISLKCDDLKSKLKESEQKREIEKQNFNEVESPMYFRSAIEILEAAYIPDEKVRESMTRYRRWQNILTKNCNSIELLKNEIKKKNCALTIDNFPEYIVQAYKFANPPIHQYFLKKYHLNSNTLIRVYNANNFHFGQSLTQAAAELVVECLKAEGSPPKKFAPPSRSRSHRRKSRSRSRSYHQKSRSHRRESSSRSRHINNRSRSSSYRSRNSK